MDINRIILNYRDNKFRRQTLRELYFSQDFVIYDFSLDFTEGQRRRQILDELVNDGTVKITPINKDLQKYKYEMTFKGKDDYSKTLRDFYGFIIAIISLIISIFALTYSIV